METTVTKERLWTKNYVLIMLVSMAISVCNYLFFSTIPLYMEKIANTTMYTGIVASAYSLSTLCVRPIIANISDRRGRVGFMVGGSLICACACVLYRYADSSGFLIASRVLHGVGFSITSTVAGAAITEVCPESRTFEGIGYYGLYVVVAQAIGPQIALSLVGDGDMQSYLQLFNVALGMCVASAVFAALVTYPFQKKRKETEEALPAKEAGTQKQIFGFEWSTLRPALILTVVYIAQTGIVSYLSVFAADFSLGNIGWFFTLNAIGTFASRTFSGWIVKRIDKRNLLRICILAMAGCFVYIGSIRTATALLVIAFPLGAVFGLVNVSLHTAIIDNTSKGKKGTASAAYYASLDIGYGIGGILMSSVRDAAGAQFIYYAGAVLLMAALGLYQKLFLSNG